MAKFRIPSIPPTTNKTVRFPNDVIASVEDAIQGKNCTFSAFVIESVRAALATFSEPVLAAVVKQMRCHNIFCVYYSSGQCILDLISLDVQGNCQDCIYVEIEEAYLQELRARYLEQYHSRNNKQ